MDVQRIGLKAIPFIHLRKFVSVYNYNCISYLYRHLRRCIYKTVLVLHKQQTRILYYIEEIYLKYFNQIKSGDA